MHTAHRLLAAVALTSAAALGLTGCLSTEPFPGQQGSRVLNDSATALRGASTFTMSGKASGQGQVNLSVSSAGECKGTIEARAAAPSTWFAPGITPSSGVTRLTCSP
ncbi:hypothetical protein ACFWIV_12780 [Streptomyces virginiae]|uniref:hypothetical protein n=1 Tax=Streptomyces virginiae TaxID=1961 RepID=UPI003651390D